MFIDGFIAAVPVANKDAYIAHARIAADVFRELGALTIVEAWEADVPEGELTSFPLAVKREAGEAIVLSWVTWPSRDVRDAAMAKMPTDPRLSPETNPMPFDGRRLIYGGFEPILTIPDQTSA